MGGKAARRLGGGHQHRQLEGRDNSACDRKDKATRAAGDRSRCNPRAGPESHPQPPSWAAAARTRPRHEQSSHGAPSAPLPAPASLSQTPVRTPGSPGPTAPLTPPGPGAAGSLPAAPRRSPSYRRTPGRPGRAERPRNPPVSPGSPAQAAAAAPSSHPCPRSPSGRQPGPSLPFRRPAHRLGAGRTAGLASR